jgi:two-component system, chemotaxis family, CheB/CheR fusion protein
MTIRSLLFGFECNGGGTVTSETTKSSQAGQGDTGAANGPVKRLPGHYVGIGASAGGLEAIEAFIRNMPPRNGLAFIIIQHLSPDYKSLMAELLSKRTEMSVRRAENGMVVEADSVYLIPPKKTLTIFHGKLILGDPERVRSGIFLPIDIFLHSLADDQGEKAIGIILSGTGSDGMRGIRAIKEAGGMVMVQDETTAKFDGMPRSAISTGLVDFVLPPDEMPKQLQAFVDHPEHSRSERSDTILTDEDGLTRIFSLLRERHKIDFTYYKPSTVVRRIERRMTVNHIIALHDYVKYLESYPRELSRLYRELLIGVTHFFRDKAAFDLLSEKYLPMLLAQAKGPLVRFWVAGCSTGEEAYSLAIACKECLDNLGLDLNIKIFATDVDNEAVLHAGNGVYPESIVADIAPEFLSRYFIRREESIQISRNIREMVVFAQHNLIKDPPFTNIDLVSCRNLLIYLQPVLQRKVLKYFSFSLNAKGVLFLGHSETIGDMEEYFEPLSHKWQLYRSRGKPREIGAELEISKTRYIQGRLSRPHFLGPQRPMRFHEEERILDRLLDAVSGDYVPLTMVVNEQLELLHVLGDSTGILRYPSGRVVNEISRIVPGELSIPLSTGIPKAFKSREEVRYTNVRLEGQGTRRTLDLRIKPFAQKKGQVAMAAVFIEKVERNETIGSIKEPLSYDLDEEAVQRIRDLEQELQFTRENLQATIEELETSNEELQATNEELLASNEELQSTNEELQSVNEELHTVNSEHQRKIIELTELNNDMYNFMEITGAGTMFFDENMELRRFTPQISRIFTVGDVDIGCPVSHLKHDLKEVDMGALIGMVAENHQRVDQEVETSGGEWYRMRVIPYYIGSESFSGSVVTFLDINELKKYQKDCLVEKSKVSRQLQRVRLVSTLSAMAETPHMTIDTIARRAVELIPDAYDPIARIKCRIQLNGSLYQTEGYQDSGSQISADVIHDNARLATLEVRCHNPAVSQKELDHLEAEDGFLKSVAESLGLVFAKINLEKARRESENRFKMLVEHIEDVFWMRTPDNQQVLYVSPAYEKIWGRDIAELHKDPGAFIQSVHADDRRKVADHLERHTQGKRDIEYRITPPDHTIRWVYERSFPIYDSDGAVEVMCGFVSDITERKNREDRCQISLSKFKRTFEKADIGMALIDMQGDTLEANATLHRMLGYEERQLNAKPMAALIQFDDAESEWANFNEMVAGKRDFFQTRRRFIRSDGRILHAHLTMTLIRNATGQPSYAICLIGRDDGAPASPK